MFLIFRSSFSQSYASKKQRDGERGMAMRITTATRMMMMMMILPPVFLQLLLLLLLMLSTFRCCSCSVSCYLPEYTDRTVSAKTWLANKLHNKNIGTLTSAQWSNLGQLKSFLGDQGPVQVDAATLASHKFVNWVLGNSESNSTHPHNFSVVPMERPGFKSEESSLMMTTYATLDINEGSTIWEVQLDQCLSDAGVFENKVSLSGAPWEVRLASRLLHERSKGSDSEWAAYINVLPQFVFLPIFFTDLELKNIQDSSIVDKVLRMRRFIEMAFQALTVEERSRAKFNDFAWAMAIVYSSACQFTHGDLSLHLLIPFISSSIEPNAKLSAVYMDGHINLIASKGIAQEMPMSLTYKSSNPSDLFLFHGQISSSRTHFQIFTSVLDLVDWYVMEYGGVNNNKYLTSKLAHDSHELLTSHLKQSNVKLVSDFSLKSDGCIDSRIICTFATLSYGKELLLSSGNHISSYIADMDIRVGTVWEQKLDALIREFSHSDPYTCKTIHGVDPRFKHALSLAFEAVCWRMQSLLNSFSSSLEEDKALLAAASWEKFSGTGLTQSGCASCRWQLEEMSFNDNIALLYRSSRKELLHQCISEIPCTDAQNSSHSRVKDSNTVNVNSSVQEFVTWMEETEFSISEKLAITHIKAGDGDPVRGVVVLKDIQQGETLCNLPLDMGLYDNETEVHGEVDAWDRAAARLLREKAKGNSSSWAPYIAILPSQMATPMNLDDHELVEVQWLPVLRELVQVRKSIKESFTSLSRSDLAWADYEEYKWAAIMVHSRAFTLPVKPDDQYAPYVMMPYMDMINHHYHYQADWISQPIWGGKLEIIARRGISKGEELFASFGPRANDNLFLYYGFMLDDNPFDIAQIFPSYEDALRWFIDLWTANCEPLKESLATNVLCKRQEWETQWKRVKKALQNVSGPSLNRDWWELSSQWANLGYQYLPYQPGPTIYAGGIVDPSLLAAFAAVADIIKVPTSTTNTTEILATFLNGPVSANNRSRNRSANPLLKNFFVCIEKNYIQNHSTIQLVEGKNLCWDIFVEVTLAEEKAARPLLIAKLSVSLRCLQMLGSFPTTIDEDRVLLEQGSRSSRCETKQPCLDLSPPSEHLQLTRKYRLMKKLLLQNSIDRLLK